MTIARGTDGATQHRRAGVAKGQLQGFDGSKLRRLRESKNLTYAELADLLELSSSSIGRWESGAQSPDPRTAKRMADLFRVPLADLVTIAEENIGLAQLRMLAGMVSAEVATHLGISRNTLAAVEAGHRQPGPLVPQLAQLYEVTPERISTTWTRVRERRMTDLRAKLDDGQAEEQ